MVSENKQKEERLLYRRAEQAVTLLSEGTRKLTDQEASGLVSDLLLHARTLEWQLDEVRQTKTELEGLRKKSTDLFEFAPVGYFILNGEGAILNANITACDMLGLCKSKLLNSSFFGLLEPAYLNSFRVYLDEMAQTGQRLSTEVKMHHEGSKVFDAQLQTVPLYENSRITYRVSVADVTERKKAEEALHASERRFRLLFDNMLDGFARCKMIYDDTGRPVDFIYLDVNSAFENLTGLKGVVGKKVTDVIPGIRESYPELFETYSRVALTGIPERFEIEFKPLDAWFDISVYSTEKGHFVAVFDNITQRKLVEQALSESTKRFRELADFFPEIMFETDLRGNVTYLNRKGFDVFGLNPDDMTNGLNVFDYVSAQDRGFATERFARTLHQGDVGRDEFQLLRQDGTLFTALVHTAIIKRDGQATGVRGIVTDITERKRIENALMGQETLLRGTMDHMLEGSQIIDTNWRYQYINEAAARQGRRSKEELLGHTMMEMYPGIEKTELFVRLKESMEKRVPQRLENEFTFPDGSKGWFELRIEPVPDGILILSLDITERKQSS